MTHASIGAAPSRSLPTSLRRIAAIGSLLLAALPSIAAAQNVALVVDRTGSVSTLRQGAPTAVPLLAALPAGTRLQLQGDASMTLLYLQTGDQYTLVGPGECELRAGAPAFDAARMQRHAAATATPVRLRVDNVALGGVVMRSGGPRLLYPAGQLTTRPSLLAWSSLLSEARYKVELRDADGMLLMQEQTRGLSLVFPADIALEPGKKYIWTLALAEDEQAVPVRATFDVGSDELQAQALLARPPDGATFSARMVYALWLEQANATGEARQLWEALARERPDEAALSARARR